jgi:Arc/MetJ-type ribon-helix-helix transcriptional regulator
VGAKGYYLWYDPSSIRAVKVSVSIPDEDVQFLDQYAADHGVDSRSGVLQRAVALLRASELGDAYAAAWDEWKSTDAASWESTASDGLASRKAR